jgi:hypothetical protein
MREEMFTLLGTVRVGNSQILKYNVRVGNIVVNNLRAKLSLVAR